MNRPARTSRTVLRWLFIAAALLCAAPTFGAGADGAMPVIAIDELESRLLRAPAEFQVTPRDTTISELDPAAFRPLRDREINRGITGAAHWVRARLSNESGRSAQSWVLQHETSYLDRLTIFHADNDASLQRTTLSDRAPFDTRLLNYRTLAFPHTTPAGGHTDLYMRLSFDKADSLTLNLRLTRADLFHDASRAENLVYGGFYGIMSAMLLIAVVFSLILRQSVYLYYAAFLAASMVMWALLNGFAYQYLWPTSVYWHNEGFHIVYLVVAITALQFSRRFLKTDQYFPRADRALRVAQWIMAGGIALRLAGVYVPVLGLSFTALMLLIVLPVLGLMAWRRGMRYARWYCAAWLFYGIGLGFSVLSAGTSVLAWGMTPLIYAQAGSVVEAGCLLMALGERLVGWDRARRHALEIANQDPLTGLGNRRALDQAFDRLEAEVGASGIPVFLAFIDLDHFKPINDRHGHDAGDAVLIHIADILRSASRPDDVCIRYGGEEFALLVQARHLDQAVEITERIRVEFERSPTRCGDIELHHTLTAGISLAISPHGDMERSEAIRRADAALYEGKHRGRNRCVAYAPDTHETVSSPGPGASAADTPR